MKRIVYVIIFLTILTSTLLFNLYFNEQISIVIKNESKTNVIALNFACNKQDLDNRFTLKENQLFRKELVPRCEGEFGIRYITNNKTFYKVLIGYIPSGKPVTIKGIIDKKDEFSFEISDNSSD